MFIPDGFGTVTPYFNVVDADKFIKFLVAAFGGVEIGRTVMDGRIANAQVKIGTSTIMVGEAREGCEAQASSFYLFVENADATMKAALDNGATLVMEVADMPYDDRQGGVSDPSGNVWWISQRLVDEPYTF